MFRVQQWWQHEACRPQRLAPGGAAADPRCGGSGADGGDLFMRCFRQEGAGGCTGLGAPHGSDLGREGPPDALQLQARSRRKEAPRSCCCEKRAPVGARSGALGARRKVLLPRKHRRGSPHGRSVMRARATPPRRAGGEASRAPLMLACARAPGGGAPAAHPWRRGLCARDGWPPGSGAAGIKGWLLPCLPPHHRSAAGAATTITERHARGSPPAAPNAGRGRALHGGGRGGCEVHALGPVFRA